jgi:hypothetical protein
MTGPRRLLLAGLMTLLMVLTVKAHVGTLWAMPRFGIDTESALMAADRWLAGDLPYNTAGFTAGPGVVQPFLYPPYTLPFLAILASLPRLAVLWAIVLFYLALSVAVCRRLSIPWMWVPLVLLWPPFSEGILAANIGIPIFAAFVFLFYRPEAQRWQPAPRDIGAPDGSDAMVGGLAIFQGAIKISQAHAWLFVFRHRRRAAILGALALLAIAAGTLLVTGTGVWFDWLEQLRLAGDPTWDLGGIAMPRFLPPGVGIVVAVACLIAVWFVPRRDPAPALGILSVVGSVSLHTFGLLFLLPAMLVIRRELALIAACFIATYAYVGSWAAILLVAGGYAAVLFGGARLAPWVAEPALRARADA